MPFVSFVQYAPNGETIINQVYFLVCPLCGAMVPRDADDHPEWQFSEWHKEWHLGLARGEDGRS